MPSNDIEDEAGGGFSRAAAAVGAAVQLGAEEGAEDVAVRAVDLDAVETGALGQGRRR